MTGVVSFAATCNQKAAMGIGVGELEALETLELKAVEEKHGE